MLLRVEDAALRVLPELRRAVLFFAGLRFAVERFAVERFAALFFAPRRAEAFAGARRRPVAFFAERERLDFFEPFRDEDFFLAAIRFLLFRTRQRPSNLVEHVAIVTRAMGRLFRPDFFPRL
jgi:hypothetical protein